MASLTPAVADTKLSMSQLKLGTNLRTATITDAATSQNATRPFISRYQRLRLMTWLVSMAWTSAISIWTALIWTALIWTALASKT